MRRFLLREICALRRIELFNLNKALAMTPLKRARLSHKWTLADVSARLAALGDRFDSGNLSRVERGTQRASAALAEKLVQVFDGELTEIHILYPERFAGADDVAA
ncbi:helix-turn-helix transcriptional regulator [Pseudomonas sp. HLS-6]|uniref:helix-turn-helix domain-containing protein n=1 Tax=Pseudomonas sp. HLS-6 TaxID=2049589 RepID=UPI002113D8FC|nr:helix-turn-helix transcriptional regulator [Pseudomonas sp. HLS-6]